MFNLTSLVNKEVQFLTCSILLSLICFILTKLVDGIREKLSLFWGIILRKNQYLIQSKFQ